MHSMIIWPVVIITVIIIISSSSRDVSATSSTSSPPPLWRLLTPVSTNDANSKSDPGVPCNRSRHHIINSTYGELVDGPGNYTQETTCEWLIEGFNTKKQKSFSCSMNRFFKNFLAKFSLAPKGHWISLFVDEVKTECSYDYLFVFDGNSYQKGQGRLLASFSGNSKPQVTLLAQSGYVSQQNLIDPFKYINVKPVPSTVLIHLFFHNLLLYRCCFFCFLIQTTLLKDLKLNILHHYAL